MSTINASSSTDLRIASSGLESLHSGGPIEQLRGGDASPGVGDVRSDGLLDDAAARLREPSRDTGEDVLNASAWGDVAEGDRLLSGDAGFEGVLGGMELSQAADAAADAVLDALD